MKNDDNKKAKFASSQIFNVPSTRETGLPQDEKKKKRRLITCSLMGEGEGVSESLIGFRIYR